MKYDGVRPRVVLLDGTVTDTWSEGWKLECMARNEHVKRVMGMLGKANRRRREAYYVSVGQLEGAEAEKRLREAVARVWKAEKDRMGKA